ncbi:MAG TPA: MFS transporter [Methylovirgula sp.]|nr:MFS transporter [Methylovirgula sp.]
MKTANVWWTVLAASFGFALVQLDVTIVNVALPSIGRALHADTSGLQWVVDAYALIFAALLLSAGFLGDLFGARRVYLAGIALFAAASAACGLAHTPIWLVAARAAQGLGAAAMLPCSLTLLNHAAHHDPQLRAKAVGWWTASGSITIAAGPIVGGLLLGAFSWRSIFLVNLPICALGALLTLKVEETVAEPEGRGLDPLGQVLAILAMGAITGAVIEAKPLGFGNAIVIAAAVTGVIAAIGFVIVEQRSRAPMLPPVLFSEGAFTPAVLYGVVVNLTFYGMVFVLALYLQRVLGYSPLKAGLAYLPLTATFFAINVFSGWWVGRAGSRIPMMAGALIDAFGFALLLPLTGSSAYWMMLPAFLLMPTGMGLGVPAMTTSVLASVDKAQSGVASGVLNAARQAGGAIGVALFGALAGGDGQAIVAGLKGSAAIAVGLLLAASLIAWWGIPTALRKD